MKPTKALKKLWGRASAHQSTPKSTTMLPQNNLNPLTCNQVVHLYPDGEIRYKWSLHHKKRDNSVPTTHILQSEKTPRASLAVSDRIRPGWGKLAKPKNFTAYAKNTIRRVAGGLQLEFGKDRLAFCTLTIPGSANIVIETIAKYSGYIMNRIQTWLSDNYQHSDGKKYALGVAELQTRGMLHWHFLVAMEDKLLIDKFRKDAEQFWYKVLKRLSKITGVDLFKRRKGDSWKDRYNEIKSHAVDVNPVYKNAAAYLAKYMSKGCKKVKSKKENIYYSPSRWWSCSRDAIAVMHSRTVVYQLPTVSLEAIKKEIMPLIKSSFNAFEMWQVELINNYRKEVIGQIGRTDYDGCREWVRDVLPVLVNGWQYCSDANIKYQKEYHSSIFKRVGKEIENRNNYKQYVAREKRQHKIYWECVSQFAMTSDKAFEVAVGSRQSLALDCLIDELLSIKTKMVYDTYSGSLIEVPV